MRVDRLVEFIHMYYDKRHNAHVYEYSKFFVQLMPNPASVLHAGAIV